MSAEKKKAAQSQRDAKDQLEQALENRPLQKYVFRLFVTGATDKSARAIENIRKLCEEYLKGRYELEIVDIYQHPEQARGEQVIAAPTLIKKLPLPIRRYIGDLSDAEKILVSLEVKEK